jgi:hypothetical protein
MNFTNDPMHSPFLWPACAFIAYCGVALLVCFRPRAFRFVLAGSLLLFAVHAYGQAAQAGPSTTASALGSNHAVEHVLNTKGNGSASAHGEAESFRIPLVLNPNQPTEPLGDIARRVRTEKALHVYTTRIVWVQDGDPLVVAASRKETVKK